MREFSTLKSAASYAMRVNGIPLVFEGPEDNYFVTIGSRQAQELRDNGLAPLSPRQIAQAA